MSTDATPEIPLTVEEVAAVIRTTPDAVRRWIRAGRLPAWLPGGKRLGYRIMRADLDAFVVASRYRPKSAGE